MTDTPPTDDSAAVREGADDGGAGEGPPTLENVPDWEDEYVDRVSDRLMHSYDLEKDEVVRGRRFTLYGELRIETSKHFLHPSITYAEHQAREHLFVQRADATVDRLESLVEFGHDLADEWVDPHEDHFGTAFTFALVAPSIPSDVRSYVEGFSDRTLLKLGYHGHYEIHLLVAAPDEEALVASENADLERAFRVWEPIPERRGRLARLVDLFRR